MDAKQIKDDIQGEDEVVEDDEIDEQLLEEPVVTVNRTKMVRGLFLAISVLGFVIFAGSLTLFRHRALKDIDGFMSLFLGVSIAFICAIVVSWIRARWICVAVLDETGLIASTLSNKYDLTWGEVVGARSYNKAQKNSKKVQVRVVLLLEGCKCLEAPIDHDQLNPLLRILFSARFKPNCDGQRLGITKGLTVILLGIVAILLGTWWAGHALNQFNNGVFFRGNIRLILLKLAAATVAPLGGLGCLIWGLYHTIAGPILYKPGYLAQHK